MNSTKFLNEVALVICALIVSSCLQEKLTKDRSDFPVLKGPYLGLSPPGSIPEIFAAGIISTELHEHSFPSFSPDGDQVLWTSQFRDDGGFPKKVIGCTLINGEWTPADFFKPISLERSSEAFYAPSGNRIYFTSRSEGTEKSKGFGGLDIWYIEKSESGWSPPSNLGLPINSPNHDFGATITLDGNFYFSREIDPAKNIYGIFRSKFLNGQYQTPELLPENINTEFLDWTPFIAPDESYLLFSSNRPGNYGEGDLYISFRNNDDTWTTPTNLGPTVNGSESQERYPYVSQDGKYLFFVSNQLDKELNNGLKHSLNFYMNKMNQHGNSYNDIYWVSAQIIDDLRPG